MLNIILLKKSLLFVIIALLMTACMPGLFAPKDPISMNSGSALQLKISEVKGDGGGSVNQQALSAARTAWLSDPANSSWFRLTDEITDPSNAVFLEITIGDMKAESEQRGTAKYGYYTYYTTSASVNLSLIDAQSGSILASYTSSDYQSSNESYPSYESVISGQMGSAIYGLMRIHTRS